MSPTLGILVNPRSGGDIRRAVAAAGRSTIEDKISIIRRIVLGARAVGVTDIAVNHDPHQIVRRATETLTGVELHTVVRELGFTEDDSTRAAIEMRELGCTCIAVLGGDGTNRAVAKGWPGVPVIPISTGTNNAFPEFIEPTVAGTALGLVAQGIVSLDDVARPAKLVHVTVEGGHPELPRDPDIAQIGGHPVLPAALPPQLCRVVIDGPVQRCIGKRLPLADDSQFVRGRSHPMGELAEEILHWGTGLSFVGAPRK